MLRVFEIKRVVRTGYVELVPGSEIDIEEAVKSACLGNPSSYDYPDPVDLLRQEVYSTAEFLGKLVKQLAEGEGRLTPATLDDLLSYKFHVTKE